jgi:hypothetical protein
MIPPSTPMLVIIDTNVLVSALLKRSSKPGQVLDLALAGKFRVALDFRQDPGARCDPYRVEENIRGLKLNGAACAGRPVVRNRV